MRENAWMRMEQRRLSRRKMLTWSAQLGVGAAGLALVGCGDDDDEQEQAAEPEPQPAPDLTARMAPGKVIIASVDVASAGAVTLQSMSPEPVSLAGWFLCQFPSYWPIPDVELQRLETIVVRVGSGEDTASTLHANGAFGSLSGNRREVALYRSGDFGNSDDMVSYVGWNGGGSRIGLARDAGLWGDGDVSADDGDTIIYTGVGAEGYAVQ